MTCVRYSKVFCQNSSKILEIDIADPQGMSDDCMEEAYDSFQERMVEIMHLSMSCTNGESAGTIDIFHIFPSIIPILGVYVHVNSCQMPPL